VNRAKQAWLNWLSVRLNAYPLAVLLFLVWLDDQASYECHIQDELATLYRIGDLNSIRTFRGAVAKVKRITRWLEALR